MKRTIILCVAIFAAFTAFAQNSMATLNHNDTVTVYYGIGALRRAYTAAVDGDIITLSSGTFYKTSIGKAITIRGAGMCYDSLTNTYPTILIDSSGNTILYTNGTPNQKLEIEGVWCAGNSLYYSGLQYAVLRKCRIYSMGPYQSHSYSRNCQFIQCIFEGGFTVDTHSWSNTFINCAINHITDGQYTLNNCVAYVIGIQYSAYNSVLLFKKPPSTFSYPLCSGSVYNCIGILDGLASDEYFAPIQRAYNHTIYGNNKFAQVFTTPITAPINYDGRAYDFGYDNQKFFLTDSIIATYPGSDGTQVGIYGGAAPFNPRPDYIRIQQCTVAPRTTLDGKLNVDIEVINEH